MICSNCGQTIDPGERFCSKCGGSAKKLKKTISPLATILIIPGAAVLIAAVVLVIIFLRPGVQKILEVNNIETSETDIAKTKSNAQTVTTTAAAETIRAATTITVSDYNIGDIGPAGGLIFYINPNYANDKWKYLEAAPTDFPGSNNDYYIPWCNGNYVETGATQTVTGTGMSNTQRIVNIQGSGSYAAKLCDDLVLNGYDDWFMPSKDELDLMHKNLHLNLFVGFASGYYWSSSELDAYGAWFRSFGNGDHGYADKSNYLRVRALRAFN